MHMKSLSLSARRYIFGPQLAKRNQESTIAMAQHMAADDLFFLDKSGTFQIRRPCEAVERVGDNLLSLTPPTH